ncbi:MAG: phytanoyl-CoA dioxygenase [Sulfurimonas sp. CG08_land_8_20_14_0_20_36_33]|nr:MAG: phytanoyl-CoA dioxygenase [Sulfurimonas sp. CG23_combo_of_CG06-09_8_20_14_all_36_33]PIS23874.1 MAG: phytanoyl-CoA dioxygenase [Sulfurimonas sp. CG08_land_8_20_14_0_20_36_33]PIU35244.1 MAG: phytanoyl-CoA dioxygenase [Sulfurimonas sp. CG07_land_8_20_14_0_80_36_56]PIV03907.1 MAG: phytanoyl-CoA dioxygenase [Sulfurimonas sp. CG03_land_8_20_14_0_80_36_25]PIV34233.1 MAG: phytanoyl-CoA dioxygenase [Sulfurimonas sp. CG02_land_8_20_14_3_00_36_67]PIV60104.1 MAG: phytanoyl-CoA dioxygenase [Sulfuri
MENNRMSIFSLSQQQKDEYFTKGYTSIKNGVSPELLKRLQNMADNFEKNIMNAYKNNKETLGACIAESKNTQHLIRYNDIHGVDWDTTLDLLASPAMMAIFRDICGKNAVPLQVDLLYKQPLSDSIVLWHQDAPHSRAYPYINVGIYLDDSNREDGCLRYVPNTQHEKQDIEKLSQKFGWDIPNSVEFPAKAGDINLHDMMILHGSKPKKHSNVRRTIYVEIRPYDGIIGDDSQSSEWAELRRRFMGLVLRRANPSDWPQEWMSEYPTDLKSDNEEIKTILQMWEPPVGANYAVFPVIHENYPVPADMRISSE